MKNVKIGDRVQLPGFPGLLEVEEISGALGTVCWKGSDGETIRNEVFLSQLRPSAWKLRGSRKPVVQPVAEENWEIPPDR